MFDDNIANSLQWSGFARAGCGTTPCIGIVMQFSEFNKALNVLILASLGRGVVKKIMSEMRRPAAHRDLYCFGEPSPSQIAKRDWTANQK